MELDYECIHKRFCELKKANCHIHITGSLPINEIRRIANLTDKDLSDFEPLENYDSFEHQQYWSASKESTASRIGLFEALKFVIDQESKDNVTYLEITINFDRMLRRGVSITEIVDAVTEAGSYAEGKAMVLKIKGGVNRKDGIESVDIVKKVFVSLPEKYQCCIDLNGKEREYSTYDFIEPFKKLKSDGIDTSIHAGEFLDQIESLEFAISAKPNRIAHAIASQHNEKVYEALHKNEITVEVSVISNLKLGNLKEPAKHPIKDFLEKEINVVLGNDDPALFRSCMTDEFMTLIDSGLSVTEIEILNTFGLCENH